MLVSWMAYAALFASLVYVGAIAAERLAAIWNRGQRFVWIASLLIAAAAPVLLATRPRSTRAAPNEAISTSAPVDGLPIVVTLRPHAHSASIIASARASAARVLPALDPFLGRAWLVASLVCLALFARAAIGVRRHRPKWRTMNLDGAHVFVAPNIGPAVVGAIRPSVIIPEWALSLDANARALMLRHEREHIRVRDPLVLLAGSVIVALFPWNPALWLLARRLRLAIEIDCDRRVLRASTQQREYGILLLTVGARNSASLPFATSLAERRPFLERRIRAMTAAHPRHARLASSACIALVLAAAAAAIRAPRPQTLGAQVPAPAAAAHVGVPVAPSVAPASAASVRPTIATPSAAPAVALKLHPTTAVAPAIASGGGPIPIEVIRALIALHYPKVMQGDPNVNVLAFVFDAKGNYVLSTSGYDAPQAQLDSARTIETKLVMEMRDRGPVSSASVSPDAVSNEVRAKLKAEAEQNVVRLREGAPLTKAGADSAAVYVALAKTRAADAAVRYVGDSAVVEASSIRVRGSTALSTLAGVVDEKTIQSIELRKFGAGTLAPLPIGVIIVELKP